MRGRAAHPHPGIYRVPPPPPRDDTKNGCVADHKNIATRLNQDLLLTNRKRNKKKRQEMCYSGWNRKDLVSFCFQ